MNKTISSLMTLLTFFTGASVLAQSPAGPPEYSVLDGNDVNLVTGKRSIVKDDLAIGTGVSRMKHSFIIYSDYFFNFRDNYFGTIANGYNQASGTFSVVSFNGISTRFKRSGDTYTDSTKSGALLEKINSNNYVYTHGDGTVIKYKKGIDDFFLGFAGSLWNPPEEYELAWATEAIYPNGLVVKIHRKAGSWNGNTYYRIQSVTNNLGMQLKYSYAADIPPSDKWAMLAWARPIEITAINNSVEYCDPVADSCSLSNVWPSVKYHWPNGEIEDGEEFRITYPNGAISTYVHGLYCSNSQSCITPRITQIIETTSSGTITHSYDYKDTYKCVADGVGWDCSTIRPKVVAQSNRGDAQWEYTYEIPPYSYVSVYNYSRGPDGYKSVRISPSGSPTEIVDGAKAAVYDLSFGKRIDKVTFGYGNSVEFDYDSIGNIIERREIPKVGSGDSIHTSTAGFENNCDANNLKTQHGAAWVKDARGNQTDYTYHCSSGNISTVTFPPDGDGFRAQTRYKYEQKYAVYKNSSGSSVASPNPVWLLVEVSTCTSGSVTENGCADPDKEVVTQYNYGSASALNNLWLKGVAVTSGNVTQRTCYQYDNYGNRVAETLPKAALSSCQ